MPNTPKPNSSLRAWHIVLIVCVAYLALILILFGNPLEFVRIGSSADPTLFSRDVEGYDGQFAYYIARDPSTAAQYMTGDVPAYRFQRILYPALAWLLSFGGQDAILPWVLVGINLIALVAGTAILERLLIEEKVSRWYALSYGLFAGVFVAVRFCTNEPLAYALALAGIVAAKRENVAAFIGLMALAILTKETTVFFAFGYGLYLLSQRRIAPAVLMGVGVLLPFALWQVVLYSKFGMLGIGSGGARATPFEIVPFMGVLRILNYGVPVFVISMFTLIPVLVSTLWALWQTGRDLLARRWQLYTFLLFANALIMPFVPFSTYAEPLGILRFMPGVVIGVLLYAARRRVRRALNYSYLWILFGLRVVG
jgi:hypothetical protein